MKLINLLEKLNLVMVIDDIFEKKFLHKINPTFQ